MKDFFKKPIFWLSIFVAIAVILRIIYFFEIKRIPFFDHPVADSKIYVDQAMRIYNGNLMPDKASFHSSPVYPYFLAVTYSLTKSLAGPRIIQALCGIANVLIIYFIALNITGVIPALIAAFLMSVYPVFICFEGDLLMIPVVIFTLNLSCLMLILYRKLNKKSYLVFAGISLGLTALGKPDTIMLAPFLALWVFFQDKNYKKGLCRVIILAFFTTLTILPVTIMNFIIEKEFVLLTTNGGVNFYIGNHKGADGMFHLPENSGLWDHKLYISSKETAEKSMGGSLSSAEVSKFWFNRGLNFIINNPVEFAGQLGKKTLLMINKFEISNHHSFYFFKKFSDILQFNPLNLSFIILFAIPGILISLFSWRRYSLLYIYLAITFGVSIMFFVTDRYRLPTIPFYIIFAGLGIYELSIMLKNRQFFKFTYIFASGGLVFALSLIHFSGFRYTLNQDFHNLGNVYADLGQYDKAIVCYKRSMKDAKSAIFKHFNIGNAYYAQGKLELALAEYIQEMEINPEFTSSYQNAARICVEKGNFNRAKNYLEKMIKIESTLDGMINLAYCYFNLNEFDKAADIYEKLSIIYPDNKTIMQGLITCYNKMGKKDQADILIKKLNQSDK